MLSGTTLGLAVAVAAGTVIGPMRLSSFALNGSLSEGGSLALLISGCVFSCSSIPIDSPSFSGLEAVPVLNPCHSPCHLLQ